MNLGPLLYHWADAHTYLPYEELSIEISLEDVERIVKQQGFKVVQRSMIPAAFNTNIRCDLALTGLCSIEGDWSAIPHHFSLLLHLASCVMLGCDVLASQVLVRFLVERIGPL